jgi:tRNA (cmo5U34)-methyltransferase
LELAVVDKRDDLYATRLSKVEAFQFDRGVAEVFEDMIGRSVPGYALLLDMLSVIATRYAQPGTRCYDLGCSLGASTLSIRGGLSLGLGLDSCEVIAVDNSSDMVEKCMENVSLDSSPIATQILCQDMLKTEFHNASVIVMNFSLQFVPAAERSDLLERIVDGLVPGGVLVLSEKIELNQSAEQDVLTSLHHGFKRMKGYSDLEIAQKRTALEQVLVPDSIDAHRKRLMDAGFSEAWRWFQCFNFASILAIK